MTQRRSLESTLERPRACEWLCAPRRTNAASETPGWRSTRFHLTDDAEPFTRIGGQMPPIGFGQIMEVIVWTSRADHSTVRDP